MEWRRTVYRRGDDLQPPQRDTLPISSTLFVVVPSPRPSATSHTSKDMICTAHTIRQHAACSVRQQRAHARVNTRRSTVIVRAEGEEKKAPVSGTLAKNSELERKLVVGAPAPLLAHGLRIVPRSIRDRRRLIVGPVWAQRGPIDHRKTTGHSPPPTRQLTP